MWFHEVDVGESKAADLGPSQSTGETDRENGGIPGRPRPIRPLARQVIAVPQHAVEIELS